MQRQRNSTAQSSCRLFVITAQDSPNAIVLRRGPSRWYHVVRWRMDSDALEPGAWFHGRIYEDRCDISPDGNLLLCFCHGGAFRPGYTDSWTAVSRAPWLHALALWPWGTTYGGGGRFVDNRRLVLRAAMAVALHPDHPGWGLEVVQGNALRHRSSGEIEGADWAGRDHNDNVIFTCDGKLFRRRASCDQEIADFGSLRPSPVPAPAWAQQPLTHG